MVADAQKSKGKLQPCIHHVMFCVPFSIASEQEGCVAIYDAHNQRQVVCIVICFCGRKECCRCAANRKGITDRGHGKRKPLSNAAVKGEEIPQDQQISVTDAMDVMIRWFCLLFGNQFSPDDVLDGYPVDRLMHDIALALMAVQTQTTEILSQFPTKAAKEPTPPQPATEAEEIPLF